MKKANLSWDSVNGADGYFIYVSKFSNPLESNGAVTSTTAVINNLSNSDVVNFGVQAFQLQTVNGLERRVPGPMAVIQFDVFDGSTRSFDGTSVQLDSIEAV